MIALRPLSGKIGFSSWNVREGKDIPPHILKTLDVKALKESGSIAEEKKSEPKSNSKGTQPDND